MTAVGDIVLVYQEEKPAFFARIEDIDADHKPNWYQVTLLVLQVPVGQVVWILREGYINGEPFTMNGTQFRIERVRGVLEAGKPTGSSETGGKEKGAVHSGKVISLLDRKKG